MPVVDTQRSVVTMIRQIVLDEVRYHRHYIGQVINIDDSLGRGRVQVDIPVLEWTGGDLAPWCTPRYPNRGIVLPDVGEWVEVYFMAGDRNKPVYLGFVSEISGQEKEVAEGEDIVFRKGEQQIAFVDEELFIDASKIILQGGGEAFAKGTTLQQYLDNLDTWLGAHFHQVTALASPTLPADTTPAQPPRASVPNIESDSIEGA